MESDVLQRTHDAYRTFTKVYAEAKMGDASLTELARSLGTLVGSFLEYNAKDPQGATESPYARPISRLIETLPPTFLGTPAFSTYVRASNLPLPAMDDAPQRVGGNGSVLPGFIGHCD